MGDVFDIGSMSLGLLDLNKIAKGYQQDSHLVV
jgi:hypothetical protein